MLPYFSTHHRSYCLGAILCVSASASALCTTILWALLGVAIASTALGTGVCGAVLGVSISPSALAAASGHYFCHVCMFFASMEWESI